MITFNKYLSKKFKGKKVLVNISDIRQINGILEAVRSDYILLKFWNKKTPAVIPINKILSVEEIEQ